MLVALSVTYASLYRQLSNFVSKIGRRMSKAYFSWNLLNSNCSNDVLRITKRRYMARTSNCWLSSFNERFSMSQDRKMQNKSSEMWNPLLTVSFDYTGKSLTNFYCNHVQSRILIIWKFLGRQPGETTLTLEGPPRQRVGTYRFAYPRWYLL